MRLIIGTMEYGTNNEQCFEPFTENHEIDVPNAFLFKGYWLVNTSERNLFEIMEKYSVHIIRFSFGQEYSHVAHGMLVID